MFMQNWHDTTVLTGVRLEEDFSVAEMVAKTWDSTIFTDLSNVYREKVVDYMFSEYSRIAHPIRMSCATGDKN